MAIQIRRGSNAEWETNNSNIVVGEPAVATDSKRAFIGTASGAYMELANLEAIAPAYDPGNSYMIDDYVSYQGKLYVCTVPTSGAWNASAWQVTSLGQALAENAYSNYETYTMSGDIVSFPNGAGGIPVKDVKANVEATQDLHGYSHPWVGGAGKNICPISTRDYSSQVEFAQISTNVKSYYTYSAIASNTGTGIGRLTLRAYNGSSMISQLYVEIPVGASSQRLSVSLDLTNVTFDKIALVGQGSAAGYNVHLEQIQLERNATMTAYEPYENICPISGWDEENVYVCGKNFCVPLLDNSASGITITANQDGSVRVDGTATAEVLSGGGTSSTRLAVFPLLKQGTYILSGNNGLRFYCSARNKDGTNAYVTNTGGTSLANFTLSPNNDSYTFTVNKPCCLIVRIDVLNGETTNKTCYPMIRLATVVDDTYEPYNGTTYITDLDGTRYGGTLDVTTGVLTLTHGYINATSVASAGASSTASYFGQVIASGAKPTANNVVANIISSQLTANTANNVIGVESNGICVNNNGAINIKIVGMTSKSAYNTYLTSNPLQIVYELATPQTVQLSPIQVRTLFGQNNIWTDSGEVEVTYRISNVQ